VKIGNYAEVSRSFHAEDLREYAELSAQVIHKTCVPEPLIGALFSYLLGVKLPGKGTMYLKQETRYLHEGSLGEALTARVEIIRLRPGKHLADLSTNCYGANNRLIATGRALVYVGYIVSRSEG